jgi:diguanylate cyclase (GGDEF)-like protein/PAS domain S-box-containing protein
MREIDDVDAYSNSLARNTLSTAAFLVLAASGLGVCTILKGALKGAEALLVVFGGLFALGVLVARFRYRKIAVQTLATASTIFYTIRICVGILISLLGKADHRSLFIYLNWLFPLLVLNKLVNAPAVGRLLARVILIAPLVIVGSCFSRVVALYPTTSVYQTIAFCLSYTCFGLMLDAVTRFREAYIVERERSESLRVESEVLESISDCFIALDSASRLVYLNDAACSEFTIDRTAALNQAIPDAIPNFFSPSMLAELRTASAQATSSVFEAQSGRQGLWYEMRCFPKLGRMSVYFRNTTKSVLSRQQLEMAHNRLREQSDLLDMAQDAIFVQDMESRVTYWNRGAERLFGWTSKEAMGQRVADIFPSAVADVKNAFSSVVQLGEWTGELSKKHKDGQSLIVESRCTLLRNDHGNPRAILAINTDVTDRKAADARIHNLAFHDVVTGLPNRVLLHERLECGCKSQLYQDSASALLFIDLDDFKTLNDTCSHDMGDMLLREVALRLISCVRKGDFVARFGGDEFVVLIEGLSADAGAAVAEAKSIGDKVLHACRQPYVLQNHEFEGTASIGATLFSGKQDTVDQLLKRADLALYRAKAQGRDTCCFFDPAMEASAASRAALLADLKRALQDRQFELHYQPQLNNHGCVIGGEALLRWRHPRRGMVSPGEFIPLAESAGLIVDLGQWVLETACSQLAAWARHPEMEALNIAVNVSIRQFLDSHFVQRVEKALRESGANPHRLKLEVTESFMVEKVDETIARMTALKAYGISFSMDDFGTGYSSLSQLKRLPLDQLKIDQSFVRDVLLGVRDASIVRAIITLGQNLDLAVIAEGVETEEQRRFLEEHGCFDYQGYLFSGALTPLRFQAFVEETRRRQEKRVTPNEIAQPPVPARLLA